MSHRWQTYNNSHKCTGVVVKYLKKAKCVRREKKKKKKRIRSSVDEKEERKKEKLDEEQLRVIERRGSGEIYRCCEKKRSNSRSRQKVNSCVQALIERIAFLVMYLDLNCCSYSCGARVTFSMR